MSEQPVDRIQELFDRVVALPAEQRAAFLESACGSDTALRAEVESLLACDADFPQGEAEGLLKSPLLRPQRRTGPTTQPALPGQTRPRLPDHLGRFRLLDEIAHGGMGTVLRAYDPEMDRTLAVKVILPQYRNDPSLVRRFLGEARLAGQLEHPGVVPVHDVGQLPDGRPFFAMKLIEGRTLDRLLRERPDPSHDLPRFLRYFEAVCQAVGYAHSRRVIHRDLKPNNIMVGAFGEVQVMDWGVAKRLGESPEGPLEATAPPPGPDASTPIPVALTVPGAVVGTPGYLAPEQARGQAGDQRADVFGLGAILCEILTGKPPFTNGGPFDFLTQARQGDLSDAMEALDGCGADAELVRLARDCLAVEPEGRPSDGSAVAAQVAEYLARVQERLRRAEVGQARALARAEGERNRRRLAVGLAGAVVALAALGGGTLLLVQRYQAEQARRQQAGEAALARAADLRQQGRWAEARAVLDQARQRLDERDGPLEDGVRRAVAELELVVRLEEVRLRAATFTGRVFARARADREYEAEFRAAGLGGPDEPAEAVAERVRDSGVRAALVAALDAWAWTTDDRRRRDWARAVARNADQGGDWSRRLRANWDNPAVLKALAGKAPIQRLSPHLLGTLAHALGDRRAAVPLLRQAHLHHPGDFWITYLLAERLYHEGQHAEAAGFCRAALAVRPDTPAVLCNLGLVLQDQKKVDEAIACYHKAMELDPKLALAHNNLGHALCGKGEVEEAIACWRKALELDPKLALAHNNLGHALYGKGKVDEAIVCFHKALALDPNSARVHTNLGDALYRKGKVDEAIVCFHKATLLDPNYAPAHNNLGHALYGKGKVDEAIVCFHKALALDPKLAGAHNNLGVALKGKGKVEEAIACYHKAIDLDPKYAKAHNNLGNALYGKGKVEEAIACYQKAIDFDPKYADAHNNLGGALLSKGKVDEAFAFLQKAIALDPKDAQAHTNLGTALHARGKVEEAIECFRKATALEPRLAMAHGGLGQALLQKGRFAEARDASARALQLLPPGHPLRTVASRQVEECRRLASLEERLSPVLRGEAAPAGAEECLDLASLCQRMQMHASAVRFAAVAFLARTKLADDLQRQHRYNAACSAALAAAGQAEDARLVPDKVARMLRRQALHWLKAELALWRRQVEQGEVGPSRLARILGHWRKDADLASLRDPEPLARLDADERQHWRNFWQEVEGLLARTKPGK